MAKRNQINLTLDDSEMHNINEYCRVHGMTPQGLFKSGAQRLIQEDILERNADLMTLKSWTEVCEGRSEPIDDLLQMIEEDSRGADEMIKPGHSTEK
ncbi:MAG: hypothetical protein GQ530_02355 [Desulfuromonadales bacterium]|nr:hypothetical protein [Desulfuromonadales bacterium]